MSKKDLADKVAEAVVAEAIEPARPLPPAAQRALAEAAERRRQRAAEAQTQAQTTQAQTSKDGQPAELGGRQGPDPVRYGDWENNGIVSDF